MSHPDKLLSPEVLSTTFVAIPPTVLGLEVDIVHCHHN